jgi:hypothetical protein
LLPPFPQSDAAISRPVSRFRSASSSSPSCSDPRPLLQVGVELSLRPTSPVRGAIAGSRRRAKISGAMSFDSDASSQGGDHRSFRQITRDRLLFEMLRSTRKNSKSTWKVLIMDKFTVKIMSYACKMADITEEGVSLVEDLYKRRQPLPSLDAIYFIQPTKENIVMFLSDMSGRSPLYKKYVQHIRPTTSYYVHFLWCFFY